MQLLARRAKQRASSRMTRRAQRGGAAWKDILDDMGTPEDPWGEIISANKTYKKLFGSVTDPISSPNPARLEVWLNCIMYQEKLFNIAFDLYMNEMKQIEDKSIAPSSARDTEYFKDVVRFINFKYNATSPSKSKLNLILDPPTAETGGLSKSTLKYFPDVFTNSFVMSLASIIDMIKVTPSQLDIEMSALVRHALSQAKSNAWRYTGYDMIDGFFLDQGQGDFATCLGGSAYVFFEGFFTELKELNARRAIPTYAQTYADTMIADMRKITKGHEWNVWTSKIWQMLTALIAYLHMDNQISTIFTLFNSPRAEEDKLLFGEGYHQVPNENLMNISLNGINPYIIAKTLTVSTVSQTKYKAKYYIDGCSILGYMTHLAKRILDTEATREAKPVILQTFTELFTGRPLGEPAPASSPGTAAAAGSV